MLLLPRQPQHNTAAYILLSVSRNKHVQLFFLAIVILGIPSCTLLDRAPAPDGNLGVCLLLHSLLCVSSGTNDQPNEVIAGVVLLRNEDLAFLFAWAVVCWRSVARICFDHLFNQEGAPVHELLLVSDFSGVETLTVLVVAGGWRGGSLALRWDV